MNPLTFIGFQPEQDTPREFKANWMSLEKERRDLVSGVPGHDKWLRMKTCLARRTSSKQFYACRKLYCPFCHMRRAMSWVKDVKAKLREVSRNNQLENLFWVIIKDETTFEPGFSTKENLKAAILCSPGSLLTKAWLDSYRQQTRKPEGALYRAVSWVGYSVAKRRTILSTVRFFCGLDCFNLFIDPSSGKLSLRPRTAVTVKITPPGTASIRLFDKHANTLLTWSFTSMQGYNCGDVLQEVAIDELRSCRNVVTGTAGVSFGPKLKS